MIINGFQLPSSFVSFAKNGALKREKGSWQLKEEIDAYGYPLETELSEIYEDSEAIMRATNELPTDFQPDGCYGEPDGPGKNIPGHIPDIIDFSEVICFGANSEDAPYCFDYRDDTNNPSIIFWADAYWRRIAPDFDSFIGLFDTRVDA
jgi:hypothetical protein